MNQTPNKSRRIQRTQGSERKIQTKSVQKFKDQNKEKTQLPPQSLAIISNVYQKFNKIWLCRGFYKLAMFKNEGSSKQIITRYFATTLKRKIKVDKINTFNKLKGISSRHKSLINFVKRLNAIEKGKRKEWKKNVLLQLKMNNFINIVEEENKKKTQTIEINRSRIISESRLTTESRPPINRSLKEKNKSVSSIRLNKSRMVEQQISQSRSQIIRIKSQYNEFKLFQLSEEVRNALIKAQRFDELLYAQETQRTCKQPLKAQMKRLEKIKHQNKLKGRFFDNEITIIALYNHIKLISLMNRELQEMENFQQKSQVSRRQDHTASRQETIEVQMSKIMKDIEESFHSREFRKSKNLINNFIKKYQKQQFAEERISFYQMFSESLQNYEQIEKCFDQTSKILDTLSMADLNETDLCLRSLRANHKDFNILTNKYKHSDKFHGKLMVHIIHNLLKLNDDIIGYLQTKKQTTKMKTKQKEKDPQLEKYQQQIKKLNLEHEKEQRKIAQLQMQLEKSKKRIEHLQQETSRFKTHQKFEKQFDKKIFNVIEKLNKKIDVRRDMQQLKNNENFKQQKPFNYFILFYQGLEHSYNQRINKEVLQIQKLLTNLESVFHRNKLTHERRFAEVAKILEISGKKDPHLSDLHKALQILMVTIVGKTQELNQNESWKSEKQKLQKSLNLEKSKVDRLNKQVENMKTSKQQSKNNSRPIRPSLSQSKLQYDESKFKQLESYKEKYVSLQAQIKEYHEKIRLYEIYQKKITVIIEKIKNGTIWKRQYDMLKKDEKLSELKMVQVLFVIKEDQQQKQQQKIEKSAEKISNILKSITQINIKKITSEKKLIEISRLVERHSKMDIFISPILGVLDEWLKTNNEVKEPENSQKFLQENKTLTEQLRKVKEENKKSLIEMRNIKSQNKKLTDELNRSKEDNKKVQIRRSVDKNRQLIEENKQLKQNLEQSAQTINQLNRKILELQKKQKQNSLKINQMEKRSPSPQKQAELKELREQKKQFLIIQRHRETIRNRTKQHTQNITKIIQTRSFEKIQKEITTLIKVYEKDQTSKEIVQVFNLLLLVLKQTIEKQPIQKLQQNNLKKTMKMVEAQIRKNKYLHNPSQYWDNFRIQDDRDGQIDAFLRVMQIWSIQMSSKVKKLNEITDQVNKIKGDERGLLALIRTIMTTIVKKQFFQSDQCWQQLLQQYENPNQIYLQLFKMIKKISLVSRDRMLEERKQNQKTVKSYENQLQKSNTLISTLQRKVYEKEEKKSLEGRRSASLSKSRKSFKSSNSEKDLQIENLKTSMQSFVIEEKKMLQKIEQISNEIQILVRKNNELQLMIKTHLQTIQLHENDKKTLQQQFQSNQKQFFQRITIIEKQRQLETKQYEYIKSQLEKQIEFLKTKINSHQPQTEIIEQEVIKALKNQQVDFNRFLQQNSLERQNYYQNIVIPERLNSFSQKYNQEFRLRRQKQTEINELRVKYESKMTEVMHQMRILESKFNQMQYSSNSHEKIISLESQISNKNIQIRQYQQHLIHKKQEIEDEHRRSLHFQREIENLRIVKSNLQSHILRLQSDITSLSAENNRLRSSRHEVEEDNLKQQIKILKKQIFSINSRDHEINAKKLLKDIQFQHKYHKFNYDQQQLQILRKIENQVGQLVHNNHQLETKITIMEGYMEQNPSTINLIDFFTRFQQKLQNIINFIQDKNLQINSEEYNKFIANSRKYLYEQNYEQYFLQWQELMIGLFVSVSEKKSFQLRNKAQELMDLKEQMSQLLQKQIQYDEDEQYETLEKYKMIFTDVKFLLREYLKNGDSQYLHMICRSMGFEEEN